MNRFGFGLVVAGVLGVAGSAGALQIGAGIPAAVLETEMRNVDGEMLTLSSAQDEGGLLVVFSCNACPWAQAWKDRIVASGNQLLDRGIGVVMVNSNDPAVVPDDDFEPMVAAAQASGMRFPYVVDADSSVARAFGATRTPELFLFNGAGELVYTGAFDDDAKNPEAVENRYLEAAVEAMLAGEPIAEPQTPSIGCSIKFREKA
ncbi:MAG: thioredoxin family protein [Candidatus Omnitrophica bacterium CG11_big_fil_rev_8_21_14_0_20_64_10]|nr:MAG: thioredoxin family protein [Candidatus Omnitrophica bacterium CG11_big_fil_rev_8_21_14_0_20_64_10]